MSDNSGSGLWILIGVFTLVMFTQPDLRSKVFSFLSNDSRSTSNSNSSGTDGSSGVAGRTESSRSRFEAANLAFLEAYKANRDLQTQIRLAKEAYRLVPDDDMPSRTILEWQIAACELTENLVGRWYEIADDGTLNRNDIWIFSADKGVKNIITTYGSSMPFEGKFKVVTGSGKPGLYIRFDGGTDYKWYANIDIAGDTLTFTKILNNAKNYARAR